MTKQLSNSDFKADPLAQFPQASAQSNNPQKEIHFDQLYKQQESAPKVHQFSHITIQQASDIKSDDEGHCCLIALVLAIYRCICCLLCCGKSDTPDTEKNQRNIGDEESPKSADSDDEEKYPSSPKEDDDKRATGTSRSNPTQNNAPLKELLKEVFDQTKNKENEAEFRRRMQRLSPAQICGLCKKDEFGIKGFLSWDTYGLNRIYECMRPDQFKAFLQGMIEIDFPRILTFIDGIKGEKRDLLFNDLLEIIDNSGKPDSLWKSLTYYENNDASFARYALVTSLRNGQYEIRFNQINKGNRDLFERALKEGFTKLVTFEQWQQAKECAKKNGFDDIQKMPKQLVKFHEVKDNPAALVALLKEICRQHQSKDEITRDLKSIINEISVEALQSYASEEINAFNITSRDFDHAIGVINALKDEKLKAFIKTVSQRAQFGVKFLQHISDAYAVTNKAAVKQIADSFLAPSLSMRKEISNLIVIFNEGSRDSNAVFTTLVGIIGRSENPSSLWEHLEDWKDQNTAFVRFALITSLRRGQFEPLFLQIYESNPSLFKKALEQHFIDKVTLEEWQKAHTWATEKGIRIEQMPKAVVEFYSHKRDLPGIIAFLQKLCQQIPIYRTDITQALKSLMKEPGLSNQLALLAEKDAFNISSRDYSTAFVVVNALTDVQLDEFIRVTYQRPDFGMKFLRALRETNHAVDLTRRDVVKRVAEFYLRPLLETEMLEQFKANRKPEAVSKVLLEALGSCDENCYFAKIADEITEDELVAFVDPKWDCFNLRAEHWFYSYEPLTGLRTLSLPKLQLFVESALRRPGLDVDLFQRLIIMIGKCDEFKKAALFSFIIPVMLASEQSRDYLSDLSQSPIGFAQHYLALALKCQEGEMQQRFELLYRKNAYLFRKAFNDGMPPHLKSAHDWLKSQGTIQFTDKNVLELFNSFRKDPVKVRDFLGITSTIRDSEIPKLKIVFKEMTVEEVFQYASKDNNCFGITNSSLRFRLSETFKQLFNAFDDAEKVSALIASTVGRSDLIKRTAELDLMVCCNDLKSPAKEALFSTLINSLIKHGKWKQFLDRDIQRLVPIIDDAKEKYFRIVDDMLAVINEPIVKTLNAEEKEALKKYLSNRSKAIPDYLK